MKFIVLLMALVLVIAMVPATFAFEKPKWTTESVESVRKRFMEQSIFREQIRQQIHDCKESEDEKCLAVREAAHSLVKNILLKICSNNEKIFDRIEERIDKNVRLTDEEKETLKESLQNQKEKLESICAEIEDADEEKIKGIVAEIRALIKESHVKFRIARRLVLLRRIGLIIERAEHLETKLDSFIEKWNCTNTTNIVPLKEQFVEQIAEARTSYDEAKELWQQFMESVQNKESDTEILREAQAKMREAQAKLKEAHMTLKEIIQELRKCRELEEEPEEVEEPEEEEEEVEGEESEEE